MEGFTEEQDELVLSGRIIGATDHATKEKTESGPVKPRCQVIEVLLDDDFWQILHVKTVKIVVNKEQLPSDLNNLNSDN